MENENKEAAPEAKNMETEMKLREEKISALEKSLAEKDAAMASIQNDLEEAKKIIVETSLDLSEAVTAYKDLAGQANPGPVAEMIKGNTIAEVNASLKSARELVAKVKQAAGAESAKVRVPAGAPQRTGADFSGLSSREKIRYGVENPR